MPFEVLDVHEIGERWPALAPKKELIGLFDPAGGYSEPDEFIPALARRDKDLGVEICERRDVCGFVTQKGQVRGVKTGSGVIEADVVICTVLAWTNRVMESLGVQLPLKAFVHQRCTTQPLELSPAIPAVNANALRGYVRPALGNRLLAGFETSEREEYRVQSRDFSLGSLSAPSGLKSEIRRELGSLVPSLGSCVWESEKVGLITFSSDGEPILGPVSKLPGLYLATAFHSGGFAYSPVSGLLLAEYVADGHTSIDVSAFSPDRFERKAVERYLASTLRQRDAFQKRH